MARIRSIKPEVTHDAKLAKVSRGTRYHFLVLWTQADDEGYFRASPRLLLGTLYPHDRDLGESAVDQMTAELVEGGFLELRQTEDGPIAKVRNWAKHQKIDHPSKSHLGPLFAKASRDPRETLAPGVLSLEPRSLDLTTKAGPDADAPAAPKVQPKADDDPRKTEQGAIGRLMGVVRKSAYLGHEPKNYDPVRDVSILRRWLKAGRSEAEIQTAIEGLRAAVDDGTVEWANPADGAHLKPGDRFTLRALVNTKNGDRFTWDVATDVGLKKPTGKIPEALHDVLRKAIA